MNPMDPAVREFVMQWRRGLLMQVDAAERFLQIGKYEPQEKSLAGPGQRK